MKVAVLMSTYNGEKFLHEQIESILAQTGNFSMDLWVRDDGSQDDTLKILEEYSIEGKLQWYSGKNLGPALSFWDLIMHCPGYDYYAFADQDDYWLPEKINSGLLMLQDECTPALYCANADLVDAELNTLGRKVYRVHPKLDFETFLCETGLMGCTMVFNDSLAQIIHNHSMPHNIIMHDAFLAGVCLTVGGKIVYDQRSFMKYRQHGNNVVGVSRGFIQTLKGRVKDILTRDTIGIAENAVELKQFPAANGDIAAWIDKVSLYRMNFLNQLLLAVSPRTHYMNLNLSIRHRLKILLGNS